MPFYAFHLDVPVPPDVVAERVRVAVGQVPTFWQSMKSSWRGPRPSGRPFLGEVTGRSFHIRRDIQYRNSFLPLIRGTIVPSPNGSRVNVFMFMHPAAFIFVLVWFGFLGTAEWRLLDANIARSYVPVAMMVFGLVLSLGGFFFEALKVMPLLSEAVFNTAIVAVPARDPESLLREKTAAPQLESSARATVAGVIVALALVAGMALLNLYEHHLRSCPAFAAAVDLVSRSTAAKSALGEPIKTGLAVRGLVRENGVAGYAILAIPMSGPIGKGIFYAVANRVLGGWTIERAVLQRGGDSQLAERIDLSPPTQRDRFDYPAPGRVYLLPLDDAAAADIKELPAYYKVRLGLDVALLPIQQLGQDTVDAKRNQLLAERALDSIEQAHEEIAGELDSEILGVTSQDLNIQTSGWTFATNYRRGRFGIMSTARLHGLPWYAGKNAEVYAVRVRKMTTKNLALLHYPLDLSPDSTSVLATSAGTTKDVDEMGESFVGARGVSSFVTDEPCVTIIQGPSGKQSWRLNCISDPPGDSRFEMFETYPAIPLFVMSRADFSFAGQPSFPFVRKYRPQDDRSLSFGIGAMDSFDIYPVGDSQTFAAMELLLADGGRVHYRRISPGTGYDDAKLRAGSYFGSPFSLSSIAWNGHGWDLDTVGGWTYQFPSSGPDRTWQQSALIGIHSSSGQTFAVQRSDSADLRELRAPDGETIEFTFDEKHRVTSGKSSSGRSVSYEYDAPGRLAHVHDPQNGDEFYEYDPVNRLTSVSDAQRRPLLVNRYGYLGEIQSQTLADGSQLLYETGYDESHRMDYFKLTLPNGYTIEWNLTRNGLTRSWPQAPRSLGTAINH